MPHRRTATIGAVPQVDLGDAEQVRASNHVDIALALLRAAFAADPDGDVSRRSVIWQYVGDLPRERRVPLSRTFAQAFQLLERAGIVCEDVDDSRGDHWFLTGFGRGLLGNNAARDELLRALGR